MFIYITFVADLSRPICVLEPCTKCSRLQRNITSTWFHCRDLTLTADDTVGLFCQFHSQVIGWKDSSLKRPIMCRVGR